MLRSEDPICYLFGFEALFAASMTDAYKDTTMSQTIKVLAAFIAVAAIAFHLATSENSAMSPSADAAPTADTFAFAISEVEDFRRASKEADMYGFLFDVSSAGQPELSRTWLVTGQAPAYRPMKDHGRTYRWEVHNEDGQVLAEGRHFDRLFNYTSSAEGACEKGILEEHSMMIRTPAPAGAATLVLTIESTRSDQED